MGRWKRWAVGILAALFSECAHEAQSFRRPRLDFLAVYQPGPAGGIFW